MKRNAHLIFRLPKGLKEAIKEESDRLDMSISDFVNYACEFLLLTSKELAVGHVTQLKTLLAKMKEEIKNK